MSSILKSLFVVRESAGSFSLVLISPKRRVEVKFAAKLTPRFALPIFQLPSNTRSIPLVLVFMALVKNCTWSIRSAG
jgi:hypothetical protein